MEYLDGRVGIVEAAKILDCHPQTIREMVRAGKLPQNKYQGKWVFTREELNALINYAPVAGRPKK